MKTVVVFGGSGFIGTRLIERLSIDPTISIVSVDLVPPREPLSAVRYVIADVRALRSLKVPPDTTRFYDLAAIHATPGHAAHEYFVTNVAGATEITALAAREKVDEIVFASSIAVYGIAEKTRTEQSAPAPVSSYGRSKLLAEGIYRNWLDSDAGRRLIIVRPGAVFGVGERGNFTRLMKLLRRGFFVYPGRRDAIKACIEVDDLVDTIEFARGQPDRSILFNAAYAQRYTLEEIVQTARAAYFPSARTFDVPLGLVRLAVRLLGAFDTRKVGLHPDRVDKLVRSNDVSPEWLKSRGQSHPDALRRALDRWHHASKGRFD